MDIYEVLNALNIKYEEIEHKAVYTVQEALDEDIPNKINGIECKNLFVKSKRKYYLIFLTAEKRADLKAIANTVGEKQLHFASEEELKEILDLNIGSVTPLGIINDTKNLVTVLIDKDLENNKVLVHPNINTKTLALDIKNLKKIIEFLNHKYILF